MILAGLAFKVSAAPFHMWTPDVYQGAPTSVTAFMAAATKTAAFVACFASRHRVPGPGDVWTIAVAVLAAISLAWGNLGALAQRDLKRMLAYSSISHAGFMLMAISAYSERGGEALLYYLIPYSAMSVGAFAVIAARERELQAPVTLDSLAGMGWERPYHGIALWTFMLGMAGFPLTGGIFGKLFVFSAAYDAGEWWLVIIGVVATAVSLGYYLNVVRWMYMRSGAELRLAVAGGSPPRDSALGVAIAAAVAVTVGSFFVVQPILDAALRRGSELAPVLGCRTVATDLTWLGHATFRVDTPGGKRVYVDPFLDGNPSCPEARARARALRPDPAHPWPRRPRRRHGPAPRALRLPCRRARRAPGLARRTRASRRTWRTRPTRAAPSPRRYHDHAHGREPLSSTEDGTYAGEPAGLVLTVEDGLDDLLRGRHERLRRHVAHRADLCARRRRAPDRRPLHDGAA